MVWVDYLIIGIIGLSTLIGFIRGFLRELLSFVIWFAALFVAWTFHQELADKLVGWTASLPIRLGAAFLILTLGVLILGAILASLLYMLLRKRKGFTGTDRILGVIFGAARGVILVAMLVFLVALTPLSKDGWWRESSLIDDFQALAEYTLEQIPQEMKDKLKQL